MVFSSVPLYPPNWQQHPNHQQVLQGNGSAGGNHDHHQNHHHHQQQQQQQHLLPPPPIPQQLGQSHQVGIGGPAAGGGLGAPPMRPNSMAEKARLAKIPPPEAPLKCPRCDSSNTKFCYFNNYSLSQPRHFCKACRRYWTRGGALRNVPVGGGCRRNKRSSSKSSGGGGGGGGGSSSSKSSLSSPTGMVGGERIPLHMDLVSTSGLGSTITGLPSAGGGTGMSSFMASLQNIAQLGMGNLGLSFGGALNAPPHPLGGLGGLSGGAGGVGSEHHQLDFPQLNPNSANQQVQFPNFLGGFEIPGSSGGAGLYTSSFQNDHQEIEGDDQHRHDHQHDHDQDQDQDNSLPKSCSSTVMSSQFAPVKMEGDGQRMNLAKQFMGMSSSDQNNNGTGHQFWGSANMGNNSAAATSMWTDLSGLNSSSTSHLL